MTDAPAVTPPSAESDFRVGRILNRTTSVLSRNFLMFFVISAVAQTPALLFTRATASTEVVQILTLFGVGILLLMVFSVLSQAVVLYGAFQDMRGRPVRLTESLQVGLSR